MDIMFDLYAYKQIGDRLFLPFRLKQFHLFVADLLLFFNDNALNELFVQIFILKYSLQITKIQ